MSTPTPEESRIDRWRKCNVNNLAEHFHRYVNDGKILGHQQFERMRFLNLSNEALIRLCFKPNPIGEQKQLTSLVINLALDKDPSPVNAFTFNAEITANYNSGEIVTEVFQSHNAIEAIQKSPAAYTGSEQVPPTFKGWLTKNWLELDITLIDDVFAACEHGEPGTRVTHRPLNRLFGYHFGPTANTHFLHFLNEHLGEIENFYLHLGVDMNKFAHREEYSFSPVFEVHLPKNLEDHEVVSIFRHGLRGATEPEELAKLNILPVYYDYSSPCPSSCKA